MFKKQKTWQCVVMLQLQDHRWFYSQGKGGRIVVQQRWSVVMRQQQQRRRRQQHHHYV